MRANTEQQVGKGFLGTAVSAVRKHGIGGTVGRYLLMRIESRDFVRSVPRGGERAFRKGLIAAFARIHGNVPCAHHPFQFVEIAKYLLSCEVDGPIVECGCFKGGSAAKLSILAEKTSRKLYVCDSFQGLPDPDDKSELHCSAVAEGMQFKPGEYRGELEEVKENIRRFGCLDACEFVPGFFSESLPGLDVDPAFIYIDVDLVSSARDCLRHLWPRLRPGGYWFKHEANLSEYVHGMFDEAWWLDTLKQPPPLVVGAGSGLSIHSPSVAYFRKKSA